MKDVSKMSERELRSELKARRFAMAEFVDRCERGKEKGMDWERVIKTLNDKAMRIARENSDNRHTLAACLVCTLLAEALEAGLEPNERRIEDE